VHHTDWPLKRKYHPDLDMSVPEDWNTLVGELSENSQVLCIVNTRKDCQELHRLMPKETFHLSANMCGEERSEVIADIKQKLDGREPVRVISTQLIEAGVDIDFPVVYRALTGIDSIAQAAGRCNREGKLNAEGRMGKVVVFIPPRPAPTGLLRKGEDASRSVLSGAGSLELASTFYKRYFETFYKSVNDFDKSKFVQRLVSGAEGALFQFRSFAQDMRLIDDNIQRGVIVYYEGRENSSIKLIDQLRRNGPESWLMRKLQRFIVNIPMRVADQLAMGDHIEDIHGYYVQKSTGLYQRGYGLLPDPQTWAQELFIVG
jgi:CRISPR-associated endonuclease/helicase Cas3